MGEGDGSVEKTVCAWAERICRLIAEATPGLSPRPNTPSALVNGLLSARQRFPETSRDPPVHRGQGTEKLCESLQAFLPAGGKGGKNKRRRPRAPGRARQALEGYRWQEKVPTNGASEQSGATAPSVVMQALVRVERALQPLLQSSGDQPRKVKTPLSARQFPTTSFSNSGTPCATPREPLSAGISSFASRGDRISQCQMSTNVEGVVPSLNLGSMRKPDTGFQSIGDEDPSTSERSHAQKSPHAELPRTEQASHQTDYIDSAAASGGAGPSIWGPDGPPPSHKAAPLCQPRLQVGFAMKPLQLPCREEVDRSMNLPERSGRDSVTSSSEVSPLAGRSGRSSASSGRPRHIPEIAVSRMTGNDCRGGIRRSEDSESGSQECREEPLRRRREVEEEQEDHDMEAPLRRREPAEMPELVSDLGKPVGLEDASLQDSRLISGMEERISRVLGLLDKVDYCIAQQQLVSQSKAQDIEALMQEVDTEPEIEAGCTLVRAGSNDEDSSDSSSSAENGHENLDEGNYL